MNCSRCDKTDGVVYTSVPPKLRCTITGKFHFGTDDCDVEFVPVVHGRWKYYNKQNKAVCTECSFERDLDADFGKAVSCPNCGARMDGEE